MLYLGSFNKNYFSVGNNPFFYQEGKSYPDDCNIKVPCFTVFDGYSSTGTYSNYSNIVSYHSILYYAPFFNNYVLADITVNAPINTLTPCFTNKVYYDITNIDTNYFPYLYNINGRSVTLPSLFFCEALNTYDGIIENCYYSPLHFYYNNINKYDTNTNRYCYVPYSVFPEFDYDTLENFENINSKDYSDSGGFYTTNMKFDFTSTIVLKEINHYGVLTDRTASYCWSFFGYVRSNEAVDLTQKNNLIEDKVAGKYEPVYYTRGELISSSHVPIYLGLSLYQMSFDDTTLYLYFLVDATGSFAYNTKTINRTDNSFEYYTYVGKDTKNKVSIGYVERYERGSDNVFRKVSEWAAINAEDTLQIGGYWKSDYIFSRNNYRIDEETTVTFTYVKNEDSAKTYSDIDLKYSGSTLDFSFLSIKPAYFTMELQRLGD